MSNSLVWSLMTLPHKCYLNQWFDKEFERLFVSKVFQRMVVRQRVALSSQRRCKCMWMKKVSGWGGSIWMYNSLLTGRLCVASVRWVRNLTSLENVKVEQYISERKYKPNVFFCGGRIEPRTLHILYIVHTNWVKFTKTNSML